MIRIRKAEFTGQEDKFYAPHDDIRNCFRPIVKAALQVAYEEAEDAATSAGLMDCAKLMARYYEDAFLAKRPVPELLGDLVKALAATGAGSLFLSSLGRAFLLYYGTAQRETSQHGDPNQEQIQSIAAVGSMLAALPDERRRQVRAWLREEGAYPEELDRNPPPGTVKEAEDAGTDSQGASGT